MMGYEGMWDEMDERHWLFLHSAGELAKGAGRAFGILQAPPLCV
jgi:hypothetical protein